MPQLILAAPRQSTIGNLQKPRGRMPRSPHEEPMTHEDNPHETTTLRLRVEIKASPDFVPPGTQKELSERDIWGLIRRFPSTT